MCCARDFFCQLTQIRTINFLKAAGISRHRLLPRWLHLWVGSVTGLLIVGETLAGTDPTNPFPPLYPEGGLFELAIKSDKPALPGKEQITGITVPHHLLVPDLIDRGFHAASKGDYKRLIILFPDHFKRLHTGVATTRRSFETPFGEIKTDRPAIDQLLTSSNVFQKSDLFERDHGIQALLPFAKHYFPDAKLIPVCLGVSSKPETWRQVAAALKPLVDEQTLVVQSTDFSHYLPAHVARQRDQEVLNLLAAGNIEAIYKLTQPAHLDSLAAQWIQMTLQHQVHKASPAVIANQNSSSGLARQTTSYIVQIYSPTNRQWPVYPDQELVYLGGDVFFGRFMRACLNDPKRAETIASTILKVTGGKPLIVNLEGVCVAREIRGLKSHQLAMPTELTLEWLEKLNVKVVSVANNHWGDLGEKSSAEARHALEASGVVVVNQGETIEFGKLRLTAFTDLSNTGPARRQLLTQELVLRATPEDKVTKFHIAMIHWGREFMPTPGTRENEITGWLRRGGYDAVIGSHPHCVASTPLEPISGGAMMRAYSLGNFLFDQSSPEANGALLELRLFRQGTGFMRWHPIQNLYLESTRSQLEAINHGSITLNSPSPSQSVTTTLGAK